MALRVELVSPERTVYSGQAEMVIARTISGGDIAFMDGHAPFLGALEIATATISGGGGDDQIAVHGGFVEVTNVPGDESSDAGVTTVVTILSDVAELSSEVDVERARRAKDAATAKVQQADGGTTEALAALRRAHVRLAAAGAL